MLAVIGKQHSTTISKSAEQPTFQYFLEINTKHTYAILITRKNLKQIEKKIENIKKKLALIAEMRPGSLSKQYKYPKNKKGAYYQLSFTHKMKSRTEYIRPVFLKEITQQVKVYKNFKVLVERWVDLSIEHSRLTMNLKKDERSKKS